MVIHNLFRIQRMVDRPVFHFQADFFLHVVFPFGITVIHGTSDHALDDPVFAELIDALDQGFDGGAVTDDRGFVGTVNDLIQFMRDDDGGKSLLFELHQQIQQHFRVFVIQG